MARPPRSALLGALGLVLAGSPLACTSPDGEGDDEAGSTGSEGSTTETTSGDSTTGASTDTGDTGGSGDTDTESGTDTGSDSSDTSLELSHAVDIQPIWDESCAPGCHEPGGFSEGVLLLDGDAFPDIVGVASAQAELNLIEPGDAEASYLIHKLRGTYAEAGGAGGTMPFGQDPLPPETIDLVAAWVDGGALP